MSNETKHKLMGKMVQLSSFRGPLGILKIAVVSLLALTFSASGAGVHLTPGEALLCYIAVFSVGMLPWLDDAIRHTD